MQSSNFPSTVTLSNQEQLLEYVSIQESRSKIGNSEICMIFKIIFPKPLF